MLVHIWCAPTWRSHTELCKFLRNISVNICGLGARTDLKLGEVSSLFTFNRITISWLYPLNGFRFIFLLRDSVNDLLFVLLFWVLMITIYNYRQNKAAKNICIEEKVKPGLALTSVRTILPCFQQVNLTWARDPIKTQHLVSAQLQTNMQPWWALNLSLRHDHVILVSGSLDMTAAN